MDSINGILRLSLYAALGSSSAVIFGIMASNLNSYSDWKWYSLWASTGAIISTKYGLDRINNNY